ncbi:MAG: hypothetical protein WC371_01310 [Parachlamydiales bacterium]|jgi:hypothetical protein
MKLKLLYITIWLGAFLGAEELASFKPWYTGTIISLSGENTPAGKVNFNPYLMLTDYYGAYNSSWKSHKTDKFLSCVPFVIVEFGISDFFSVAFETSVFYNRCLSKDACQFGDFDLMLNFQILKQIPGEIRPSLRIMVDQLFPTGSYTRFSPYKAYSEWSSYGAFETTFSLLISKIVYWLKNHPVNWRFNLSYSFPAPCHVEGFNAYGGGFGTYGKAHLGNLLNCILTFELSLNQRWVLAADLFYQHSRRSSFHGISGTSLAGTPAALGFPACDLIQIAPALEYNFNADLGLFGGIVFSVEGRNISQFYTPTLALSYTF